MSDNCLKKTLFWIFFQISISLAFFFNCTCWSIFPSTSSDDLFRWIPDVWNVEEAVVVIMKTFLLKSDVSRSRNRSSSSDTHLCHTWLKPDSQSHFLHDDKVWIFCIKMVIILLITLLEGYNAALSQIQFGTVERQHNGSRVWAPTSNNATSTILIPKGNGTHQSKKQTLIYVKIQMKTFIVPGIVSFS